MGRSCGVRAPVYRRVWRGPSTPVSGHPGAPLPGARALRSRRWAAPQLAELSAGRALAPTELEAHSPARDAFPAARCPETSPGLVAAALLDPHRARERYYAVSTASERPGLLAATLS